ncbi:hypothetical protein HQ496_14920 [bacterium]|nr:hypothetical protein [bacterium]
MRRYFILALLFLSTSAFGQQLKIGKAQAGTLTHDSKEVYTFEASVDFFVYGYVDQQTVDVVVRVLDPSGKEVLKNDGPDRGPEPFQFTPKVTGKYTVEVSSFEGAEGAYSILLVSAEPKQKTPKSWLIS